MTKRFLTTLVVLVILGLVLPAPLYGYAAAFHQSSPTVTGRVTDEHGSGIPDVTIIAVLEHLSVYLPLIAKPGSGSSMSNLPPPASGRNYYVVKTNANGDYTLDTLPPGRYVITAHKAGLDFNPLSYTIITPASHGGYDFQSVIIPTVYKSGAINLSQATLEQLISLSENGADYLFSSQASELALVHPGDVIIGGITPLTPEGFIRRVISITNTGGSWAVKTEPAALEDAFESLSISTAQELTPTQVQSLASASGIALMANPSLMGSEDFEFVLNNAVLYDKDGSLATNGDQVIANGTLLVSPMVEFRLRIEGGALKEYYYTSSMSVETGFTVSSSLSLSIPLSEKTLMPTIELGAIPVGSVILTPTLDLVGGISGSVFAGVTTSISNSTAFTAGLWHVNDHTRSLNSFTSTFSSTPLVFDSGVSFEAFVGPSVSVRIYGSVGGYVKAGIAANLSVAPASDPWLTLKGGLKVAAGASVALPIINKVLLDIQLGAIDYWVQLYSLSTSANTQPNPPGNPSPPHEAADQSRVPQLRWSGGDPDGDALAYDVFLDLGAVVPITKVADHQFATQFDPGTLSAGATYSWRVRVFDQHGAYTDGPVWRFSVAADVTPPTNFGKLSPANTATGLPTSLTLDWDDSSGAANYQYCFDTTNDNACANWISTGTTSQAVLGGLSANTTYYWQVRATNSAGTTYANTDATAYWRFATAEGNTGTTQAIAAGGNHTCALSTSGGVKCWGKNSFGQLGDGSVIDRPTPVSVSGLSSGVRAIAAGMYRTCALMQTGAVKCWGQGYGLTPIDVSGISNDVQLIAVGYHHICVLTTFGGLKCWGENSNGQLGDNTTTDRLTPVDVFGLSSGAQAVTASELHTCGLTASGGAVCWGYNYDGRLGDGTTTERLIPTGVVGLSSSVQAVATGWSYTCALMTSGGVKCWGDNTNGQLGDGTMTHRLTPVDVIGLPTGMQSIVGGGAHTCVLTTSGGVKCWGLNADGQLGDGTLSRRLTPVDVSGLLGGVQAVSTGEFHTCVVTTTREVKCWGDNSYGQLGDGTTTDRTTPVTVIGLETTSFSKLTPMNNANGLPSSLTLDWEESPGATDYQYCYDSTNDNACENWVSTGTTSQVTLSGLSPNTTYTWQVRAVNDDGMTYANGNATAFWSFATAGGENNAQAIATGWYHTCVLTATSGVMCWGDNGSGQLGDGSTTSRLTPVDVLGLSSGVQSVSTMGTHTCALTTSGGVKCWGDNGSGQLGDGTTTNRSTPVDVSGLTSGVQAVAAGGSHTCVLLDTGGVRCWGYNGGGQLGDGTTAHRFTPVDVVGLTGGVQAIVANLSYTCALTTSGGVKCWGDNTNGQLGDGSTLNRLTPVDVAGLTSGVRAITAGGTHTCALMTSGGVKCWGYNGGGQVGDGTTINRLTPVDVTSLGSGVQAITAGGTHTCALTTTGGVMCWGNNVYGQLGDGTIFPRPSPINVNGLSSGVQTISVSGQYLTIYYGHSCAVLQTGGVKCWGYNNSGQLGDGTTINRLTPVSVVGIP